MTSDEYWDEIGSIAREVTKEAREYDRDITEVLHEIINDHKWVIYYRNNGFVLSHSENSSYGLNEGLISTVKDHDEYMTQAAYWAMYADVSEHESFDADGEEDDDAA
jgi:hypothetical protein